METGLQARDSDNYLEVIVDTMQVKINNCNDILDFPRGRLQEVIVIGIDDEGHLYGAGTPKSKLALKLLKDLRKIIKQNKSEDE